MSMFRSQVSVQRTTARYRKGTEQYFEGIGHGGRPVPIAFLNKLTLPAGGTLNRDVFDELRDQFEDWQIYDNSGSTPSLIDSKVPVGTAPPVQARPRPITDVVPGARPLEVVERPAGLGQDLVDAWLAEVDGWGRRWPGGSRPRACSDGLGQAGEAARADAAQQLADFIAKKLHMPAVTVLLDPDLPEADAHFHEQTLTVRVSDRLSGQRLYLTVAHDVFHGYETWLKLWVAAWRDRADRQQLQDRFRVVADRWLAAALAWAGREPPPWVVALADLLERDSADAAARREALEQAFIDVQQAAAGSDTAADLPPAVHRHTAADRAYRKTITEWLVWAAEQRLAEQPWRRVEFVGPDGLVGSWYEVHADGTVRLSDGRLIRAGEWLPVVAGFYHPGTHSLLLADPESADEGQILQVDDGLAAHLGAIMVSEPVTLARTFDGVSVGGRVITLPYTGAPVTMPPAPRPVPATAAQSGPQPQPETRATVAGDAVGLVEEFAGVWAGYRSWDDTVGWAVAGGGDGGVWAALGQGLRDLIGPVAAAGTPREVSSVWQRLTALLDRYGQRRDALGEAARHALPGLAELRGPQPPPAAGQSLPGLAELRGPQPPPAAGQSLPGLAELRGPQPPPAAGQSLPGLAELRGPQPPPRSTIVAALFGLSTKLPFDVGEWLRSLPSEPGEWFDRDALQRRMTRLGLEPEDVRGDNNCLSPKLACDGRWVSAAACVRRRRLVAGAGRPAVAQVGGRPVAGRFRYGQPGFAVAVLRAPAVSAGRHVGADPGPAGPVGDGHRELELLE